jgi:hypothetical protein
MTHRFWRAAPTPRLLALIGVAALVGACGGTPTPSPVTTGSPSPSAASSAPSTQAPSADAAGGGGAPTPSVGPDGSASPQASETPLPTVSPSPPARLGERLQRHRQEPQLLRCPRGERGLGRLLRGPAARLVR